MSNVLGRQAVVIGAGMSGLAAAGALANHFEQVTVLERVAVRHLARPDDALHERGLVERVKAEMAAASSATAELAPLAA